jgi:hypothetical protein
MVARAPSVYVPLDANYLRDPRIRRAGPDAELLYLRALAYAKAGETDGMVWDYDLGAIAVGLRRVESRVASLVEEKAWEVRDEGWFICGWFNWNEPVAKLRVRRQSQAVGAAKTNHKKHRTNGLEFLGSCFVCLGEVEA